jgi:integrase
MTPLTRINVLSIVLTIMASIWKHPKSPFYSACFRLPDGTRTKRSTGTTNRRKAQRIASEFEDAARAASEGRFIESRARRAIADIYALGNPEAALGSSTVADYLDRWLARKELEAGANTHEKYSSVVAQFKKHLGAKGKRDISNVTASDVTGFRDDLACRLSIGTVNVALKIIRAAFAQARRDGLVDVNEAERVTTLKRRSDRFERRPFTLEELKRIIEAADPEWKGLILFGLYTGQRLGDIATLTWQNVDLQRQELRLLTEKTSRRQIIPLAPPLLRYAEALPSSDKPDAPIFPKAYAIVERLGRASQLSNQFYDLLVTAGLAKEKTHNPKPGEEKGRGAKRVMNAVSFHSLRHTATSLLKAAGVSEAVAMEFVGHDSSTISRQYTHIETANLKEAAAKLPDIMQ